MSILVVSISANVFIEAANIPIATAAPTKPLISPPHLFIATDIPTKPAISPAIAAIATARELGSIVDKAHIEAVNIPMAIAKVLRASALSLFWNASKDSPTPSSIPFTDSTNSVIPPNILVEFSSALPIPFKKLAMSSIIFPIPTPVINLTISPQGIPMINSLMLLKVLVIRSFISKKTTSTLSVIVRTVVTNLDLAAAQSISWNDSATLRATSLALLPSSISVSLALLT